jgi:hypothetical protein
MISDENLLTITTLKGLAYIENFVLHRLLQQTWYLSWGSKYSATVGMEWC